MYRNKHFLLIAGGGTLGTYTAKELLRHGALVDVICPEEKHSDDPRLVFHRGLATDELLASLFRETHYDGIVNFIHYKDPAEYRRVYPMLIANTDHLIFLSSYRVYAESKDPITEESPRILDVVTDRDFLENEDYARPKSVCEDFLRSEHPNDPWTIVRPVISFSSLRLDLLLYSKTRVLTAAEEGTPLPLPETVRNYGAGIDWAGNSGKLIANLFLKPTAFGETFTVYSGHGMTWGEVADAYTEVTGATFRWCKEEEYLETVSEGTKRWMWRYDRRFDRRIDASKILGVTGLGNGDFASVADGIRAEIAVLGWKKP